MNKELKDKLIKIIEEETYLDASNCRQLNGISTKYKPEEVMSYQNVHNVVGYKLTGTLYVHYNDDGEHRSYDDVDYYFDKDGKMTKEEELDCISDYQFIEEEDEDDD